MGHITDLDVSAMNDRIAQASTTAQAFAILEGCTRTMVDRLLDLNGHDVAALKGFGLVARQDLVAADHGWGRAERDDHPLAGTVAHPQIWPNYIDNPRRPSA